MRVQQHGPRLPAGHGILKPVMWTYRHVRGRLGWAVAACVVASCAGAATQSPQEVVSRYMAESKPQPTAAARRLMLDSRDAPEGPRGVSVEPLLIRRTTRWIGPQGEDLDVVEQDGRRGLGLRMALSSSLHSPHTALQRFAASILDASPQTFWDNLPAEWRRKVTPAELWRVVTHPDAWSVSRELADGIRSLSGHARSTDAADQVLSAGRFEIHMLRRTEGWVIHDIRPHSAFMAPSSRD